MPTGIEFIKPKGSETALDGKETMAVAKESATVFKIIMAIEREMAAAG